MNPLGIVDASDPNFHYGKTATQNARPFRYIALHHTADKPLQNLVDYGKSVDQERGGAFGYHYYVGRDGSIVQGAPMDKRTNHIKPPSHAARSGRRGDASNSNTLGITLVGGADGETPEQLEAAEALVRYLGKEHGIGMDAVFGHGEVQNDRQATEGAALLARLTSGEGQTTMAGAQGSDTLAAAKAELARREALAAAKAELARRESAQPAPGAIANSDIPAGMVPIRDEAGNIVRYHDTEAEAEIMARENPIATNIGASASQLLKGVPFVREYFDEAAGAIDEAFGGQEGLREEQYRARDERFERKNPYLSTGLNIAGGAVSTIPLAVGPVAAAISKAAPSSLAGRMAVGGVGGVAGGAAEGAVGGYGAGRNNTERRANAREQAVIGGAAGGVLGAVAPAIGRGVSNLTESVLGRPDRSAAGQMGLSPEAAEVVGRMIEADDPARAVGNIADAGVDGMIADAGPATSGLLDATIQMAGPAGGIARRAIDDRAARATVEVSETLDQFLGKSRGVKQQGRDIAKRTAAARQKAYDAAYSTPINYATPQGRKVEEVLSRIPSKDMRKALEEANADMVADGLSNQQIMAQIDDAGGVTFVEMPNVMQLDYIKRALDKAGSATDVFGRMTAEARRPAKLAKELRNAIADAAVSDSGVRTYDRALNLGSDKIAEDKSLAIGYRLLKPSTTVEDVIEQMDGANAADIRQAKAGLRRAIDEIMANVKKVASDPNLDAREGAKAFAELSSRANRDKIAAIMGPDDAAKMLQRIDRASKAFTLRAQTATNSKTFARGEVKQAIQDYTDPGAVGQLMQGNPMQAVRQVVQSMTNMTPQARRQTEERIAGEIATALTERRGARAGDAADRIVEMLRRRPETERLADLVARAVAGGSLAIGYTGAQAANQ